MFAHSPHQRISASELNMFDRLFFEAELPKTDLPEEIRDQDMSELEFQTSDLNQEMDVWSVSTAGELFYHEVEKNVVESSETSESFMVEETPMGIKKVEETKSVHFYRVFEGKENDYWISFDALFHKGKLVLVDVNEINTINKEERQKAKAHANEFMQKIKERQEKKTNIILKPFKFAIGLSLVVLHFVGSRLSKFHSNL
tara:strand:- start:534 stop:1133 length:600 start_codon:yes stop_codon:yes gene_type:complete